MLKSLFSVCMGPESMSNGTSAKARAIWSTDFCSICEFPSKFKCFKELTDKRGVRSCKRWQLHKNRVLKAVRDETGDRSLTEHPDKQRVSKAIKDNRNDTLLTECISVRSKVCKAVSDDREETSVTFSQP